MNNGETQSQPGPLVSVCIPVYNCETYIGEAIQSILSQSFQDFEIVVVDNASTDRTKEVVQSFQDARIRLILNETNVGPCRNWNISMEESRGKYIKMVGADDLLYPDCLEEQVRVFEDHAGEEVAVVCCPRDIIDAAGKVMFRNHGWQTRSRAIRMHGRHAVRSMARAGRNLIGEPLTLLFRRRDALSLGGFDPEVYRRLPFCLDWDLWCRLLQRGDLHVCANALGAFRVNAGSESLTLANHFAKYDRLFIESLRDRNLAELRPTDVLLGAIRSWRDAWLRRGFYSFLQMRKMLPTQ